MRLGLVHINMGPMSQPDALVKAAQAAEAAGFDSVWAGEHIVLPDPQVPQSPMRPQDPALDSLLALAWAAAHTAVIRLATGVVIVPQRNPVVLAKQVASLDVLSGGRLLLGVGAGYLEPEMTAVGVPLSQRGGRTDEYLDAMTALWTDEAPAFHGQYVSFDKVDAHPRPVQAGGPRIVIGGHSPAAFRRAVARGHGWFGNGGPDDLVRCLDGLKRAAAEVERPARLGRLEITFLQLNPVTVDASAARRYAELGVNRLVVYPLPLEDPDDVLRFLEQHAALPH